MTRLTFFLSGEHPTVPPAEVLASIEAEGHDFQVDEELDQVLTVETDASPMALSRRLGMTHAIIEHFCTAETGDLLEAVGDSDLVDFLPQSETISVRVRRIKNHLEGVDTQELAGQIADALLEVFDYEVDLERPDNEISILLTEEKCVLGIVRARVNRSGFGERKPPERAAVHPSTMQPNLARALVNLARTPRDGTLLDPFAGVGGVLLEAGLIGAELVGVDIKPEQIEGARENLEEAGLAGFDLRCGDARDLDLGQVDAIATDPPYGRQASTGGSDLEELYRDVFPVLERSLKPGRYLSISAPSELDLGEISGDLSLELVEKHGQRVHKSLSRNIYVFRRSQD